MSPTPNHRTPLGGLVETGLRLGANPLRESTALLGDAGAFILNIPNLPEIWVQLPDYKKQDIGINTLLGLSAAKLPHGQISTLARGRAVWEATAGKVGRFARTQTPWGRSVWQRSDVDWLLRRPDGLTNLQAAKRGFAPMRRVRGSCEKLELHHLNQEAKRGLAEVWASTHRKVNHNALPPSWRTTNPDAATAFRRETPAYWRWWANQILGE